MDMMFWGLTDAEISRGLDLVHDGALRDQNPMDPMIGFTYDHKLQRMAMMLVDCGWDRDLMRLRYADELESMADALVIYKV